MTAEAAADGSHQNRSRAYGLQWLRFFAALAVVVYHASGYLANSTGATWATEAVPNWTGILGVSLFFALSGNLMAGAMMRQGATTFLLHRVVRIYPAFLMATGAAFLVSTFIPIGAPFDWRSLTLAPVGPATYRLGVEWTLVFEVSFYIFVFALIAFRRQGSAVFALVAWLGIILWHNLLWPDNPSVNVFTVRDIAFVAVNVSFAMGMLLPLVAKQRIHPILAAIVGVDVWLLGYTLLGFTGMRWGIGIGAALFVYSLHQFKGFRAFFGETPLGRLGNRLGDYAYALYLCHVVTVRATYALLHDYPSPFLLTLAIVLSILVAVVLGELDIRVYRWSKAIIDRSPTTPKSVAASIFLALFFLTALVGVVA